LFSFWRLPGANASGLELQAFWKAILVYAHISKVQGDKIIPFCCGSHTYRRKLHHSKRIKFPNENSTVLRKRLAANVLALSAKAGTAVAC
jgi:hypothetical protein